MSSSHEQQLDLSGGVGMETLEKTQGRDNFWVGTLNMGQIQITL